MLQDERDYRGFAFVAVSGSLVLHIMLVWLVLQQGVEVARVRPPVAVTLVRESPPVVPKPVVQKPPVPVVHPKAVVPPKKLAVPLPGRVVSVPHFGAAGAQDGLSMGLAAPSGGSGQGSMAGFDDAVKQRIAADKTYPPGIKFMWNECVVAYRVSIDRSGQLLDYKLYGCGNPFLDSAARAAILMASPYPVPPDFGGSQYTVYGSLVFKH